MQVPDELIEAIKKNEIIVDSPLRILLANHLHTDRAAIVMELLGLPASILYIHGKEYRLQITPYNVEY